MSKYIFLLLVILLTTVIKAQEKHILFTNIDKTKGLSHNRIHVFLKDKNGFVWIGTDEGLCRFDGYSFKVFKNNPKDTLSIKDNKITNLFEDNKGNIWIAAGDYLVIFDPETEKFTLKQELFDNRILVPNDSKWFNTYDNNNDIIFANNKTGLYKYIVSLDSVIKIELPFNESLYTISWMEADKKGDIWIACTNAFLYKIDGSVYNTTEKVQLVKKSDNSYQFYIDNDNDLWIFDKNHSLGALFYRTSTKELKYFTTQSMECKLNNNTVTGYVQDDDNNIWIATDHGGINMINKNDFSVKYIINNPFNERSICDNSIMVLYKDYQGFIWVGSFKKGLSYYHKNLFNFSLYKIKLDDSKIPGYNDIDNFAEDKKGNLWIGTNGGGLIYFDRKNNTFRQYANSLEDNTTISANIIVGMLMDSKERLWIGTYFGGLNLFDGRKFYHFRNNPNDITTISDDRIWDICEDRNGKLWIATLLGGVNLFDPESKKVIKHFYWDNDSSIRTNVVFSIIQDRDGLMWFATVDGLRSYNPQTGKFEYYIHNEKNPESLSKNLVYDVFEDSRGLIWAGTKDGLNMFNKTTGTFKVFRQEDGLCSNFILTITEDNDRNLWVSTSNGISNLIISRDTKNMKMLFTIKNYDVLDGLQGNEFNEKAAFKTSKGELLFGGPNGFNLFNPNYINIKNIEAKTVLTDFQVFNKSINNTTLLNNRKLLDKSITYVNEIKLKYIENVITIEFSNLNFFHPDRRKYKYILENFDDDWYITGSSDRKVTYTNLNPGKYIFRVIASNTDGTWGNNEALLNITIMPPFWKTVFFKILLILIIISIGISIYYLRLYNLARQKSELEKNIKERTKELSEANVLLEERQEEIIVQKAELEQHHENLEKLVNERTIELEKAINNAKESDRLKTSFLANMSHEIRTPMNAIIGFAALLKNLDENSHERNEYIDIINQNCESLLVLINDIIDISKIESNQINIVNSKFSATNILKDIEHYYKLNNSKGLEISFTQNKMYNSLFLNNDSFRFRQVVSNLISNAFKFTDKGYIRFGYEVLNDKARFFVKDSGIGISERDFIKIFDYFHKIEDSNEKFFRGAGLGLSVCKKLVTLMGGEIWLESEYGKGSAFYFTLPYESPVPAEIEEIPVASKEEITDLKETTILIAEDEPINYYLIEKILKPTNAKLIWAKDGKKAVDIVKEFASNENLIVLMDIRMPVMNGIDALKHIRDIDKKIPVIALTAYAYETDRFEILKKDFDDYITKPIKPEMLVDVIRKFIK